MINAVHINSEKIERNVVVIGASAGGIEAVSKLLSKLPADLPAVIGIVIHRGAVTQTSWAEMLGRRSSLTVVEPEQGQRLTQGVVYIAPSDRHMTFGLDRVFLDLSLKEHFTRPAIDPLFCSAAQTYAARVVGIVLTGSGRDGTRGLIDITTAGGLSLVQQPSEAKYAPMPEYALAHDHVHASLTLDVLADILPRLTLGLEVALQPEIASVVQHV